MNKQIKSPLSDSTDKSAGMGQLFEHAPIWKALAVMAVPTVISQLITLIYNIADTWFIGRTNNPYMIAASSLSSNVFLTLIVLANLFGTGGGNLVVSLLGKNERAEAKNCAAYSLVCAFFASLAVSAICLFFWRPLLMFLGASPETLEYAHQYLLYVVTLGAVPTVLANTMSFMLRNVGYAREAAVGLGIGGILNIALDPLFMFVLLPKGQEVTGAAAATLLSNIVSLVYYVIVYIRIRSTTVLTLPVRFVKIRPKSRRLIYSVGTPAALSLMFYNTTNIVINMLSAAHGDIELAAIGIILKVERLPLNIGIGICLGMMPLVAYNFSKGDLKRSRQFFKAGRTAGVVISILSFIFYWTFSRQIIAMFIQEQQTVLLGTIYLRARSFAPLLMFLSFHMVHYMQAIGKGRISFDLALIRQLVLNIPFLIVLNHLFGMTGVIWTQASADFVNVLISYIIYQNVRKNYQRRQPISET